MYVHNTILAAYPLQGEGEKSTPPHIFNLSLKKIKQKKFVGVGVISYWEGGDTLSKTFLLID